MRECFVKHVLSGAGPYVGLVRRSAGSSLGGASVCIVTL